MFTEPHIYPENKGWIEVIAGSMFSGKTEELIRRLKRAQIANKSVKIFKPTTDNRYHTTDIVSHNKNGIPSIPVERAEDILPLVEDAEVVAIDEAQFFDNNLTKVCSMLALKGIRVIVAGLDMDYKGIPFGPMPELMAIAEYVTKLHAICMQCGGIANFSYRKTISEEQILLGEIETYEARCRKCFEQDQK